MLAILCPGQGAQSNGFLTPWLAVDGVAETVRQLSTRACIDLVALGRDDDADVVDTAVAQPLIVAVGLATARLLGPLPTATVVVGHSVGELTAASVAEMVTPAAAVDIARERGRSMAKASAVVPSGMVAILGGDRDDVTHAVEAVGCWVANHNATGQVVAAGPAAAVQRLVAEPPAGARVRPLAVAGAFHTPVMEPARADLERLLDGLPTRPAARGVVSNADGAVVTDGAELARRLVRQVTQPVRFDLCLQTLQRLGVTATLELAPAGVLTNLVRRELPGVEAVALRSPADLDAAHDLLDAHGAPGEQWTEPWLVLVAPASGTLQLAAAGSTVAVVRNRSGDVPVQRDRDVAIVEWLAGDGDPVREGQPLARLLAGAQ